MHFSTLAAFSISLLAATASAWSLTITASDGRELTSEGTFNSDCVTYDSRFEMTDPITHASFDGSLWADTFELFAGEDCEGQMYRNGEGDHALNEPFVIKSYSVY